MEILWTIEDNHGAIFGIWVHKLYKMSEKTHVVVRDKNEKTIKTSIEQNF